MTPTPSRSHLVLIPSYNTGAKVLETLREARRHWNPVWVVVDGSTDGSGQLLSEFAARDPAVRVLVLSRNQGKGAAIFFGLTEAAKAGYSHVLSMDADGQHDPEAITPFMRASKQKPAAVILGLPSFDASAPQLRVQGRKISNFWANLETLWLGVGDSLFGLRVYPVAPLLEIMRSQRWMRRFDFDVEAAVRLSWKGLPLINLSTPVKYFKPEEGGVSHFHYLRDNALLTWMHTRLMLGFLLRLPQLLVRKLRQQRRD